MKLQTKLLTLYAVSTILIMFVLGGVFYSTLWDKRLSSIREDILNQLRHLDFSLNAFFAEVESDVNNLAENETVRSKGDRDFTRFLNADEKTYKYHIREPEQKIIDILNNYRVTHPYVNSVYMGRENGSFVRSHKRERPTRYDPRDRPWYILAKNNPGNTMKTEAYPSLTTSDINIGIVRALVDKSGIFYGVVGTDVTLMNLTNYITNFKINPKGKIIIADRNGLVLAGLSKDMLFKNIKTYSSDFMKIFTPSVQGFAYVNINNEKNYVFFINSTELNWKIAVIIPFQNIKKIIIAQIAMTFSGLVIGLILLSILTLIGLNVYVVRPLKKFTDETDYISKTSDLERSIDITSKDEIGLLANSYNHMIRTLRRTYLSLKDTEVDLIEHRDHLDTMVKDRTAQLQEANEKLSSEIKERIQTLNELAIAKEHAEASDRLKSAFLATMSHELRTPLNSIIGFTGIILQGIVGPLNDEQKKQLNMVRGSAQHLLSLINDILDISKIEAGQLQIADEKYNLRHTIEKAVESARPLADKKGLELTCSISPEIENINGDRRRLEQILLNLISNAIKFTEKGSVKIECEREEGKVTVKVIDTGIGIKPEDMETIFKAFRQIDSGLTRKYEGTGLGLSICKRLVDIMGGNINVTSVWGSGSTFSFSLPEERRRYERKNPCN
ncbi:MAG: HAMP domain-containing protein [Proteobacteria bacterium]|nr:HAMP domain-containing protein [Pseudomonadota bacterium]MBU1712241.1 HAMP domain-containing protein [Pseudomonadota bacterium]